MKSTTITCDGCGRDLTVTGNCVDYRLALLNENVPSRGGFVTLAMDYPRIEHDCYFCGIGCLVKWLRQEYPKLMARAA